ncbi:hypothetical protein PIN31115_04430 [Pandoraea iniqua]|uniref:Uncharacterized protein n=1 Tax=Pandoraea iniqua TaxID=2508288 RepID=A0A5E4YDF1_9BURK|nr:DUF3540 domain-containing protein [Pandoraea iniqua]VVE46769.1 hypothetical protein PIN31115_04430 [Pandoraea iniqua]
MGEIQRVDTDGKVGTQVAGDLNGVTWWHATVRIAQGDCFGIVVAEALRLASLAPSCLLRPGLGDRVLVSACGDDIYIVAVLRQAQRDARKELDFGAGAKLVVQDGSVQWYAQRFYVEAPQWAWQGDAAEWVGEQWRAIFRTHDQYAERRYTAAVFDEQCFGDSVRSIEGHERVQVGSCSTVAEHDATMQAQDITLLGVARVKIDTDGDILLG